MPLKFDEGETISISAAAQSAVDGQIMGFEIDKTISGRD